MLWVLVCGSIIVHRAQPRGIPRFAKGTFAVAVALELRVLLMKLFYFLIANAGRTRIAIVKSTRALSSPCALLTPGSFEPLCFAYSGLFRALCFAYSGWSAIQSSVSSLSAPSEQSSTLSPSSSAPSIMRSISQSCKS